MKVYSIEFGGGQKKRGVEKGGAYICEKLNIPIHKIILPRRTSHFWNALQDIHDKLTVTDNVSKTVTDDRRQIYIGGDHSCSISTVAHTSSRYDNVFLIWIDAHADINSPSTSTTHNKHGMPVNYICGLTPSKWESVPVERVYYLGLRNVDNPEWDIIYRENICFFGIDEFREFGGAQQICQWIMNDIRKKCGDKCRPNIHISFDVDSLDPSICNSTGTPVENGFTVEEVRDVARLFEVYTVAVDIMEFNPTIGNPNKSVDNLKQVLDVWIA